MVSYQTRLIVEGASFQPLLVEQQTGILFSKKAEAGSIGTIGRYRGIPVPYGFAELMCSSPQVDSMLPAAFVRDVEAIVSSSVLHGATSIVLHIDVAFQTQCNLEFSPQDLAELSRLGVVVTVSCFESVFTEEG